VQLLAIIVHHEEVLGEVLSTLVEQELPDAVVVETRTGLGLLERDLPIFAGVRTLVPGGLDFCRLVLCPIEDDGAAREALEALESIAVPVLPGEPRTTAFLVPITAMRDL